MADNTLILPVLPLRDVVIYPHVIMPLLVGREKSVDAIKQSIDLYKKKVLLIAQKNATLEELKEQDLYRVGTVCSILQMLTLPDKTIKVLVEGDNRASIRKFVFDDKLMLAQVNLIEETENTETEEEEALVHLALTTFKQYLQLNKNIPYDILSALAEIKEVGKIADTIAAHLPLKLNERQDLLEIADGLKRLEKLTGFLKNAVDLLEVEQRITARMQKQVKKNQREYFLKEQMEAIQKELGDGEECNELNKLTQEIEKSGMSKEARTKAESELKKLKMMPPVSAEATVARNYLDYLVGFPWKKATRINQDLTKAEKILNDDHYGLEKVKERIVEYLAVQHRVQKIRGPILCLVGPPGVGKTSLGQSVARATGRKFVRMSLGGIRDEAEIRGHRRTYVGALPGKIVQNLSRVGVRNPFFLLDEIDKVDSDFRGDPAAALLEVLDPEQNNTFNDHYLEVDCDLSDVLFVATANTLDISAPLLDRMEVINLSGYTEDEKINIALKHLLPKQLKMNGLKAHELVIPQPIIEDIIRYYTREAGVRNLEREISKICRKVVKQILIKSTVKGITVTRESLEDYLGVRRFRFGEKEEQDRVGQATGLAWTEVGGELLTVEAATVTGKGNATVTGQLGNVMQESIKAAMTVVRSRSKQFGIPDDYFEKHDIHVHVPEGAIPKDGPSGGITMCTALVSSVTGIPIRAEFAMTGEITLRGEVLPIGGLKEKLLAARRGSITHVIIPQENIKDLKEIPDNVKQGLDIHPVRWIDQVWELALTRKPSSSVPAEMPILSDRLSSSVQSSQSIEMSDKRTH